MSADRNKWVPISDELPILVCEYSFGPGLASAIAVPCEGGFAVVSPPSNVPDSVDSDLEERGAVRAIVAPNAYHTMGVAPWKARFPDARVFAPAQSIARVAKKSGISAIEPLSSAAKMAGSELELLDIPHYRTGEALVRFKRGQKVVWYVTDVVMNMPKPPPRFPFKQIFTWTKSAPGLRPNALAATFMMKNKKAVYRWLRSEIESAPPTMLIACHGDHVVSDAASRLLEILPA